ncbi:MAG: LLM class flavin-dependent oxidoreductase [Desulforhabdus sp.]|jgi:alkanesulfonate monooxygenase SsuD/methylene tetrahydromethanopterin reductase-like flavin-dependent oxidoreductase (luciferase family)|nr:LLM class flavin-dependent oxidoreductase [Desulforhabdus sp.]
MRIGYLIDLHKGGYDQPVPQSDDVVKTMDMMINEGILAEKYGFHSIEIPHRHGRTECYFPGPEQIMTILARETEKVALGTYTFVSTLYHPMHSAEQFAVIDNLSKGRLFTTVSRGYHPAYWQQFGVPQEKLLGRFKESIAIWNEAFKGERFSFHGKHYTVEDGLLTPGPYQKGGWPLWGGGNANPEAIKRSAEISECWTCDPYPLDKEVWDKHTGAYRDAAIERGKKPFIVLMRDAWVADSFEEAARVFGTHYADDLKFYFEKGIFVNHPQFKSLSDITPERVAEHAIMGTPEQCREKLERYHEEFGVDYFTVRFRMVTGPSMSEAADQIQKFAEEVVQPIHKKYPAINHPAIPEVCRW